MTGRRLTTGITLTCLVVVLVVMFAWGYQELTRPLPDPAVATQTCSKSELSVQRYVHRRQITVTVLNAGAPSGFAGRTLNRFEDLGFQPGAVANAPKGMHAGKPVVYSTDGSADAAARLVARTLGKHVQVKKATSDLGPGVTVLVGSKKGHPKKSAPKRIKLKHPIKSCVRVK